MVNQVFTLEAKIGIALAIITNEIKELMKIKTVLVFGFFLMTSAVSLAQEIANHAFGLRLGESDGIGASLSYQKSIGRYNRLELDFGYQDSREFDAAKITALFQTVYSLDGIFNWYYGFGGGAGTADFTPTLDPNGQAFKPDGGLFVFAAGDIGVEANLNMPLVISLDIRPEIGLLGYKSFDNKFNFDVGLGIRYQF